MSVDNLAGYVGLQEVKTYKCDDGTTFDDIKLAVAHQANVQMEYNLKVLIEQSQFVPSDAATVQSIINLLVSDKDDIHSIISCFNKTMRKLKC